MSLSPSPQFTANKRGRAPNFVVLSFLYRTSDFLFESGGFTVVSRFAASIFLADFSLIGVILRSRILFFLLMHTTGDTFRRSRFTELGKSRMMRMRTKSNGLPQMSGGLGDGGGVSCGRGGRSEAGEKPWELRPGGMLVQKRTEADQSHVPPPPIRVRVKYGSVYHEIHINSQASFGELKKMLAGPTGLHHQDQKLFYKDKERDSNTFLDSVGVKDKSKIVLVEDAISQEKRYLEMRKTAKMEKAAKSVSEISMEVDRLAGKVSALETVVSKGGKVVEKDVVDLIELLMNQLLKLDGIVADGEVKLQRKIQVRRVQKHVEILDVLKLKNSATVSNGNQVVTPTQQNQPQQQKYANGHTASPFQPLMNSKGNVTSPVQPRHSCGNSLTDSPKHIQDQPSRQSSSTSAVVITTQWETFDSTPAPTPGTHTIGTNTFHPVQPKFTWDLL